MLIVLLLLVNTSIPAFAGNGDGSGGGQGNPLSLAAASPANGQQGVPTTGQINLTFTKNVINMSVKNNNLTCFSLTTASGESVPILVLMADDQMEPEKKREIAVKPKAELKPGTTYRLTIAAGLQSKSGVTLGKPVTLSFTTAGTAPEITPAPVQTEKSPTVEQNNTTVNNTSKEVGKPETAQQTKPSTQATAEKPKQQATTKELSTGEATDNKVTASDSTVKSKEEAAVIKQPNEEKPIGKALSGTVMLLTGLGIMVVAGYLMRKNKGK